MAAEPYRIPIALKRCFDGQYRPGELSTLMIAKDLDRKGQPARCSGSRQLAVGKALQDHGRHGGPRGLFNLSDVQYVKARRVAADVRRRVDRPLPPGVTELNTAWQGN
jgi:hypothetical protein